MTVSLRLRGRRLTDNTRRHRDDRSEVAEVAGHDERRALLRQLAELAHVLLADAQLHRLDATAFGQSAADLAQALRSSRRDCEDCRGLAVRLVDLLLFARLGRFDDALLVAFGLVDLSVPLTLGRQHHGALFPLSAHLLLHRPTAPTMRALG